MAGGGDTDPATHALGVVAGVLLAICLMPQLWKMYRTKSAQDISYGWTAFYFLGLVFYFIYLFRLDAIVGWIGILVEAVLVVFVVIGKFYLEHYYQPRHGTKGRKVPPSASTVGLRDDVIDGSGSSKRGRSNGAPEVVAADSLAVVGGEAAGTETTTTGQVVVEMSPTAGGTAGGVNSTRSSQNLL